MSDSPRATVAYLAWLSIRTGEAVIPSSPCVRAARRPDELWPDSTDSQTQAMSARAVELVRTVPERHRAATAGGAASPVPGPPTSRTPFALSQASADERFGQPRTPSSSGRER